MNSKRLQVGIQNPERGFHNVDKIHIRGLLIRCIIGVYERERKHKQDVLLNITLHTDLLAAALLTA